MMHSTKILQVGSLHWSAILKWTTQGPRAILFLKIGHVVYQIKESPEYSNMVVNSLPDDPPSCDRGYGVYRS